MKFLVLLSCIAVARAGLIGATAGQSVETRSQDALGNYASVYDIKQLDGGHFRAESGDAAGNKVGSYGLTDADGRVRRVNYVADALGFRASIDSNEPGVEPKDSADVSFGKTVLAAPAPIVQAPVLAAPAWRAPVLSAPLLAAPAVTKVFSQAPLYSAPVAIASAPAVSYSTSISHAAPIKVLQAAPVVSYATAPALSAPILGHSVQYSSAINHGGAITKVLAAPTFLSTKGSAPLLQQKIIY